MEIIGENIKKIMGGGDRKAHKFGEYGFYDTLKNLIKLLGGHILLYLYYKPLRRRNNIHNRTTIKHLFDFGKVKIGNYTYGELDIGETYSDCKIIIGNYCSLAGGIQFIGGNHNCNHFSTYPFASIIGDKANKKIKYRFNKNYPDLEHVINGNIIIDDDVRIGTGAKIMGGVHIGQGAVIAAGAVVTKDIPPYAIAGGIPAKVIKYRFSEDKIKKLLQINYSKIPIEKFREIYPETIKVDFDIDYILKKLKE